jgi:hypothetical protein
LSARANQGWAAPHKLTADRVGPRRCATRLSPGRTSQPSQELVPARPGRTVGTPEGVQGPHGLHDAPVGPAGWCDDRGEPFATPVASGSTSSPLGRVARLAAVSGQGRRQSRGPGGESNFTHRIRWERSHLRMVATVVVDRCPRKTLNKIKMRQMQRRNLAVLCASGGHTTVDRANPSAHSGRGARGLLPRKIATRAAQVCRRTARSCRSMWGCRPWSEAPVVRQVVPPARGMTPQRQRVA